MAILKNGRQSPHTTRVNISASNPPKIEILLSKYTFSGVLIRNKVFLNTLIQQNNKDFPDSIGSHSTKWPTKSEYVSISQLLNHLESKYFLSKYTFSGVPIQKKMLNTLIQQKYFTDSSGGHCTDWPTKYTCIRVNITASNPREIGIFVSEYTLSGALLKNYV